MPTWFLARFSPPAPARFVHLPPPTLLGIPARGDASATLIQPTLMASPTVWRHTSSTSRPTTLARSFDTELFEDHSSFVQPPDHLIPRRRAVPQGQHAPAAFSEIGPTARHHVGRTSIILLRPRPLLRFSHKTVLADLMKAPRASFQSLCFSFLYCGPTLAFSRDCHYSEPLSVPFLFSWLPSPRKIRRRRRQFRGCSNQLEVTLADALAARNADVMGSLPVHSGPDFSLGSAV